MIGHVLGAALASAADSVLSLWRSEAIGRAHAGAQVLTDLEEQVDVVEPVEPVELYSHFDCPCGGELETFDNSPESSARIDSWIEKHRHCRWECAEKGCAVVHPCRCLACLDEEEAANPAECELCQSLLAEHAVLAIACGTPGCPNCSHQMSAPGSTPPVEQTSPEAVTSPTASGPPTSTASGGGTASAAAKVAPHDTGGPGAGGAGQPHGRPTSQLLHAASGALAQYNDLLHMTPGSQRPRWLDKFRTELRDRAAHFEAQGD